MGYYMVLPQYEFKCYCCTLFSYKKIKLAFSELMKGFLTCQGYIRTIPFNAVGDFPSLDTIKNYLLCFSKF